MINKLKYLLYPNDAFKKTRKLLKLDAHIHVLMYLGLNVVINSHLK